MPLGKIQKAFFFASWSTDLLLFSPVTLILVNRGLLWKILSFSATLAWEYHLLLFCLLLTGADYVISSNTIKELVLGTTHVDT